MNCSLIRFHPYPPRLVAEDAAAVVDDLLEDVLPDVGVDGREGVVEQVDLGVVVHRPRQAHPLLLPAAQVDPLLADLGPVAAGQHLQVGAERARVDGGVVGGAGEVRTEGDVVAHRAVLHPGLLRHVGHLAADGDSAGLDLQLSEEGADEGGLAGPDGAHDGGQRALPDLQVNVLQHHRVPRGPSEVSILDGHCMAGNEFKIHFSPHDLLRLLSSARIQGLL